MSLAMPETDPNVTPRRLLAMAVPAILVGVLSALLLWALEKVADLLGGVLWTTLARRARRRPVGLVDHPHPHRDRSRRRHRAAGAARPRRARQRHHRAHGQAAVAQGAARARDRHGPRLWPAASASAPRTRSSRSTRRSSSRSSCGSSPVSAAARDAARRRRDRRSPVRHPGRRGTALHRDPGGPAIGRFAVGSAVPPGGRRRRRRDDDAPAGCAAVRVRPAGLRRAAGDRLRHRIAAGLRVRADRPGHAVCAAARLPGTARAAVSRSSSRRSAACSSASWASSAARSRCSRA